MSKLMKKILTFVCAFAMVVTALAGLNVTTAKAADDIILNGDEKGASAMIGTYTTGDKDYKWLGFATLKDATADYKYLVLTYAGDVTYVRFEFVLAEDGTNKETTGPIWFNKDQAAHFVTADGSDIPLDGGNGTTVIIDLAKSGIEPGKYNGVHMHSGDATVASNTVTISMARLTDKAEVTAVDVTPEATTADPNAPTTTKADAPTNAPSDSTEDLILNGDENGQSSMMKSWNVKQEYKYLGFATLKEPTAAYKYLILTYSGDITSIRFEFTHVDAEGNDTGKVGPYWFNKEGQTLFFETADGSDIPLDGGKGTTIVLDLEKTGIDLSKVNSVHMHAGYGSEAKEFDFAIGMARLSTKADVTSIDSMDSATQPATTAAPTTVKAPGKATVSSASKKKSAKKIKVSLKKVNTAVGYQVAIYATKKAAKSDKTGAKALVSKVVKKVSANISSKKIKGKKALFVKARAYVTDTKGTKVYGAWSAPKKAKIKK